jgi:hypothetical protein
VCWQRVVDQTYLLLLLLLQAYVLTLLRDVAAGMSYLHSRNVLHGERLGWGACIHYG